MAPRTWIRRCVGIAALGVAAGCGGGERDVTLAISEVRWQDPQTVVITTECAGEVRVEVGTDAGGSNSPQLSVFGDPKLGRCTPEVAVAVPEGTTKIVDAATSQVIELPPLG